MERVHLPAKPGAMARAATAPADVSILILSA